MQTQDIFTAAFRELVLIWPGQAPSTDQLNDGFNALNRLVPSWSTDRLLVYAVTQFTNLLTPSEQSYTIGNGGVFNTTRPIAIRNANIITAAGRFVSRLELVDEAGFSAKPGRSRLAALPLKLWYQAAYPLGVLWFWPVPNAAATVELFVWTQLAQFASLAATFDLPPGYELAIVKNLAVLLAPMFGRPVTQDLMRDAMQAKAAISGVNAPPIAGLAEELAAMPQPAQPQPNRAA